MDFHCVAQIAKIGGFIGLFRSCNSNVLLLYIFEGVHAAVARVSRIGRDRQRDVMMMSLKCDVKDLALANAADNQGFVGLSDGEGRSGRSLVHFGGHRHRR